MANKLDQFLVVEKVVDIHHFTKLWVGCGGKSNHLPIFQELKNRPVKPPSPLKFNKTWLKDESILSLISSKWIPFNPNSRRTTSF